MTRRLAAILSMLVFATGCAAPTQPPATTAPASATPAASTSAAPSAAPSPTSSPTPVPSFAAARFPVRGETVPDGESILLAPAPDGSLYVMIADPEGAVLGRLDRDGAPPAGWPVVLPHATGCLYVGAAADGSVRAICNATDIRQPDLCCDTVRAFALDRAGRPLPGWPVEIDTIDAARTVGVDLIVVIDAPTTDVLAYGEVTSRVHVARIVPEGAIDRGDAEPIVHRGGYQTWAVGPDGIAYGTLYIAPHDGSELFTASEIAAIGIDGSVPGWPVSIDGIASAPGFAADGGILVAVGAYDEPPLYVVAIPRGGRAAAGSSAALPMQALASGIDCGAGLIAPLGGESMIVAGDGATTFFALDSALNTLHGWPYAAPRGLQGMGFLEPGTVDCAGGPPAAPALGESTLYVPQAALSDAEGGALQAIGPDGAPVNGWPVKLRRAEAGFWRVAAAPGGLVFALAVEREAGGASATVLAIAPDGTIRWRVTVLEP